MRFVYFTEGNDKWTYPKCCKTSRITLSNSSSSARHEASATTPVAATGSDQLSLIMSQLASIAMDIKDIKDSQSRLSNDVAQYTTLLQQHSDIISRHDASITNILSNIEAIENRLLQLQKNTPSTSEAPTAELLERFRRSHNIVIRGVPEASDRDDASTVSTIIGLTDDSVNAHITGISRLGSTSSTNRTRPLKVCFSNPQSAMKILRNKRAILQNPSYRNMSITDDKTPAQISHLNLPREELNCRQAAGERDITIKYVTGTPRIVSLPKGGEEQAKSGSKKVELLGIEGL
nr:unnamed protein product [Callosobruchus chinensis]